MASAERPALWRAAALLAAVAWLDCADRRDELVVLAAEPLADCFRELGAAYERTHPHERLVFRFDDEDVLAARVRESAPAHVLAVEHGRVLDRLADEKRVLDVRHFAASAGARYHVGTVANGRRYRALRFIAFLEGDEGQAILREHGCATAG